MTRKLLVAVAAAIIGLGSLAGTVGTIGSASAQGFKKGGNKGGGGNIVFVKPKPGPGPVVRRNNNGRNAGIAAAIIAGTIIAAGAANANRSERRSYRDEGRGLSCRSLERRCDDGQNWACRRLEERPDC